MAKTTTACLLLACLLSSCAVQTICPAYQSAFILDENKQREAYSLFVEVDGTFVPKRPYGFKYNVEDGDSLMRKFVDGTKGKGFRVQKGRVHSQEKFGFEYENRIKEGLIARVFNGKERPVLENPYLFDRITKKRPFYKLDQIEMDIVHFDTKRYDSIVAHVVDTARYRVLMEEMNALPPPIQAQYSPLLRGKFNVEQEQYNKRYGEYFLRLREAPKMSAEDSLKMQQAQLDSLAADSTSTKKGIFGLFKKKKKNKEEETPEGDKNNSPNNDAVRREEELE
ncbi:hypothetical protein BXY85_0484 [Roseivirga pacifica]|uniref:Uncharacterized protein n=1 Tax=Roseivirga pacifica TaxID=1267423 RepID=A0A1I0RSW4_9BACT|nr:hypothetical protein [Roseivirga pacifica]RKQ49495.1 hypothetical protein BXY85_0484 [Roseivirga pacifica]SEW44377.1 hypothetical protein SAMN05216290_4073 [Roseivirga pacifica]